MKVTVEQNLFASPAKRREAGEADKPKARRERERRPDCLMPLSFILAHRARTNGSLPRTYPLVHLTNRSRPLRRSTSLVSSRLDRARRAARAVSLQGDGGVV